MSSNHTEAGNLPNYAMIAIFLLIVVILFIFGDTFTALLGTFIIGLVFALNYKSDDTHGHH